MHLPLPFHALVDDAEVSDWGQFVFDRGQRDAAHAGLLSVVISASSAAVELEQKVLAESIAAKLARVLGIPELARPFWSKVISEKRATFACTPGLFMRDPANSNFAPTPSTPKLTVIFS